LFGARKEWQWQSLDEKSSFFPGEYLKQAKCIWSDKNEAILPQGIKTRPNNKKFFLSKCIKKEKIKQIHRVICNKYLFILQLRESKQN